MIEYNDENVKKMRDLAQQMLGTCMSLEPELEKEFGTDDTSEFDTRLLREFDDITMQCESCQWYTEPGFIDEDGNCDDCAVQGDDDD